MTKTFAETWEEFNQLILVPVRAGTTQVTETRRAFYAGGWAFYALVMEMLDADREPTAKDLFKMEALHKEFLAFHKLVREGKA